MYAKMMSHEWINSYMSINTKEKAKRKLNVTEFNLKKTQINNEQAFSFSNMFLSGLGYQEKKIPTF